MPTPRLAEQTMREAVAIVEEALKLGYRPAHLAPSGGGDVGAVSYAARLAVDRGLCGNENTFRGRIRIARERGIEPDWSVYRRPQELNAYVDHVYLRHEAPVEDVMREETPIRVAVIGDLHADSRQDLRRCDWIGRWIGEHGPDHVVQIGDFATFDSVNQHETPGSRGAMARPPIERDFDCIEESCRRIATGMAGHKPKLDITLGNHENRLERYENMHPEVGNVLSTKRDGIFASYGWRTREYGALRYIGGVAFTHAPLNGVGRAYGGKTANHRLTSDSVHTIVRGHDHKREIATGAKIGGTVDTISVGCALEWGWVEPYAKHSPSGWWWGVAEMTVADGRVWSVSWIDMLEMRQRYGR